MWDPRVNPMGRGPTLPAECSWGSSWRQGSTAWRFPGDGWRRPCGCSWFYWFVGLIERFSLEQSTNPSSLKLITYDQCLWHPVGMRKESYRWLSGDNCLEKECPDNQTLPFGSWPFARDAPAFGHPVFWERHYCGWPSSFLISSSPRHNSKFNVGCLLFFQFVLREFGVKWSWFSFSVSTELLSQVYLKNSTQKTGFLPLRN